jgi:hypothetical protein
MRPLLLSQCLNPPAQYIKHLEDALEFHRVAAPLLAPLGETDAMTNEGDVVEYNLEELLLRDLVQLQRFLGHETLLKR